MSDQDNNNIFDDKNKATDQSASTEVKPKVEENTGNNTPDINVLLKDHLGSIVDDSGEPKYRDVYTALEALKASQQHIKNLEQENSMFRESQTKADTMEEALRKLSAQQGQSDSTKSPDFDAETLKGMTLETLKQWEAEKAAQANEQAVSSALVNKFGDAEKAKEAYAKKAEELGLDAETFRTLAQRSPKAVLSYFDVKGQGTFDKNLEGSVNTEAMRSSTPTPTTPRNIMYGSSSGDVVNAWKAAGQSVLNELGNK